MIDKKAVIGVIGEHLVLAELLRRGAEAYLAQGSTNAGFDIVVLLNQKPILIEVKSVCNYISDEQIPSKVVKCNNNSIINATFDYMIFVDFQLGRCYDGDLNAQFFIMNFNEVKSIYKMKSLKSTEKSAVTICKSYYNDTRYKNNWCSSS